MCEVAEYFESGELVVFDDPDPAQHYVDEMESDGTDDSKSDFPEAECAMALLELAQSFGFVSSLDSFDNVGVDPAPSDAAAGSAYIHLNDFVEGLATSTVTQQHPAVFDKSFFASDMRTMSDCSARTSAIDLLSIVRLDHSYETRRSHCPGSTSSIKKAPKKARSAATLEKLRKNRRKGSQRKVMQQNEMFEERQTAALRSSASSHTVRNVFPVAASQVNSQYHRLPSSMNASIEVPLEDPFRIASNVNAVFGIRDKSELFSS